MNTNPIPEALAALGRRLAIDTSQWLVRGALDLLVDGSTHVKMTRGLSTRDIVLESRLMELPSPGLERDALLSGLMLHATAMFKRHLGVLVLGSDRNRLTLQAHVDGTDPVRFGEILEMFLSEVDEWKAVAGEYRQ